MHCVQENIEILSGKDKARPRICWFMTRILLVNNRNWCNAVFFSFTLATCHVSAIRSEDSTLKDPVILFVFYVTVLSDKLLSNLFTYHRVDFFLQICCTFSQNFFIRDSQILWIIPLIFLAFPPSRLHRPSKGKKVDWYMISSQTVKHSTRHFMLMQRDQSQP